MEASYNWQFVANDGSLGIHNTAYTVGLLKASIANLEGKVIRGADHPWWVVCLSASDGWTDRFAWPSRCPRFLSGFRYLSFQELTTIVICWSNSVLGASELPRTNWKLE